MPSVLHVSETLLGGVGSVVTDLVQAEVEAGWSVSIAAPADAATTELVEMSGGQAHYWSPPPRPGASLPRELHNLRRAVAAVAPDLLHLHSSMAGMCGRLVVRRRIPTLFQPHSWSFFAVQQPVSSAALAWERWAARWADLVLCVSEDEREHANAAHVRGRITVVPNGVDLQRFERADDSARELARASLGLGPEPLALLPGRLHRQKGQSRLLDAWPEVLAVVPDARLVLAGEGPDRQALAARELPGVRLVGQVADIRPWLAAADVVVMPSTWEGMSLALLEARASSRSVVVTDVPGMREVVVPGTGAVVPLGDARALADAVSRRLADPRLTKSEGTAARADVERRHDLSVQRARVLELSAMLAKRPRRD